MNHVYERTVYEPTGERKVLTVAVAPSDDGLCDCRLLARCGVMQRCYTCGGLGHWTLTAETLDSLWEQATADYLVRG